MMSRLFVVAMLAVLAGCNTDGSASNTTQSLNNPVAVSSPVPANSAAPTISGTPATSVRAGAAYSFKPTASAVSGNVLQFSIQNKPVWAIFDASSGGLTGTPTSAQAGSYANIVIGVSNGSATSALPAFSIVVNAAGAPSITGSPQTAVLVGSPYKFIPTASDPAGAALTFAIQNKPSWANFSASTGELSGTPGAANVGTTNNIVISVSNGNDSSTLPVFSVAVQQSATGSATLSWNPPSQNTDGTALTNLAGYKIYYGTARASMTQTISVSNPGLSSYFVGNLTPATWYFAVKSLTTANVESALSSVVSKVVK